MKITMVVVIYKQVPEESKTFLTLKHMLFSKKAYWEDFELILYDNSLEKNDISLINYEGINISYFHDPRNLGIANAYNFALSQAKKNGSKWLLLLDHDTEITNEYVDKIFNLSKMPSDVVAIVPKINCENTMISPVFSHSLRPLAGERPASGIQKNPVMAINSGALIQVDFLSKINGFNQNFPLDYLDHWLFNEIYEKGFKVWLLDVILEHELSVMDYSRISLNRYKSILDSEMNFYKNYKKDLYSSYRAQLAKRLLKQLLTVKNKKIAMYTLKRLLSM